MTSVSFGDNYHGFQMRDNHGPINVNHLPPKRPETPPSPLSTVPFARDRDFVSRDILLRQIREKSSAPGSRIALVGLGGVGKSQLAIEYSYQVRSESPATWVLWVHASNEARFEQSFRDIAHQIRIPGHQDPKINIFKLVEHWLRDEKNGKWICILDNVDSDEFLCSLPVARKGPSTKEPPDASMKPLLEYVPKSRNGSIIITSRSRHVALKMVKHKDIIQIDPMERSEALELLQKTLDQPGESQESQQLVEVLEFMPLAIIQAASYIRYQTPLSSFDYIRRQKTSAAELLSLMSFFDRQGIPENLVRFQPKANYKSGSELADDSSGSEASESDMGPDFEDDINTLRDYSFISISDNNLFTMHRLVQLTTRAWLKSHGQINQWREKSIRNLYQEFPFCQYENWDQCRSLFPHVRAAISQRPESQESLLRWATILYKGAWYALESGNIADAKDMASKSRKQRLKLLHAENEVALASTAMLARACLLEGRWEEAEQLNEQVLEIRKTKLGVDHPDTLTIMANLATTYSNQGRWDEAELLEVQVLEIRKTKLGVDHPDTLRSMAHLATTYWYQGRWNEAELLEVQVLEIRKTKLAVDHPDTLKSMANLVSIYINQSRWNEAEQLEIQFLKIRRTKLGADHPETLTNMAHQASMYCNQGRWEKAEQLNIQVLETRKTKLGMDHPDTLTSMANLATTFWNQGRWKEAEQLDMQALEIRKTKLGVDHPDTLTSVDHQASMYCNQGRWDEAEKLETKVLEIRKTKLGVDHPETLRSMANLATTFCNQGRWEKAEQLHIQVLESCKTKLGVDHPDTLTNMANLATTFWNQGRWKEAEQLDVQTLEIRKTKLGVDHPDTLTSMANLATTFCNQGRWEEAEQLNEQALETRKTKLGVDHPDTLTSMANLAFTWKSSGSNTRALDLLRDCLAKQKQILGLNHHHALSNSKTLLQWETEMLYLYR
ncbi:hypothetical protein N7450_011593 [Penicillium hetheringtonii]|uniref:DUF7779 domain-containing protein n=1 Tax=Penicillium hetheringtonii TaxID=911720 RepID=A0AAD6GN46_9EURO|nr:hypothetical protein N7450_011593 [Penicillium hetheringtonii]